MPIAVQVYDRLKMSGEKRSLRPTPAPQFIRIFYQTASDHNPALRCAYKLLPLSLEHVT